MFELPAWLLAWFYGLTHNYAIAIALIAVVVMLIITPLTLKSTKGMLEMQRLAPQMRKLQQQHRNDRQKLNEEMMKLYQEHKVNPMSSCLPLLAQMPVFIIMFRILTRPDLQADAAPPSRSSTPCSGRPETTRRRSSASCPGTSPTPASCSQSLSANGQFDKTEMVSFGLDLAMSPIQALSEGFGTGLVYALLVVALAGLYFLQQRMVAARAAVSPTMSPTQQKLMQYLPVVFAIFQVFFLAGLIIYYMAQAVLRIGQQAYITRRFYGHEESLGRQAQRAGDEARELAKKDGGGGGLFGQPAAKQAAKADPAKPAKPAAAGAADDLETNDAPEGPPDAERQDARAVRATASSGRPERERPRAVASAGADVRAAQKTE